MQAARISGGFAKRHLIRGQRESVPDCQHSTQTELRLVNVARASLDELLLDYEDFLRQRGLRQWEKDDSQAQEVRAVGKKVQTNQSDPTDQSDAWAYAPWLNDSDSTIVANTIICLIHQTNYLLDRQIVGLERKFIHDKRKLPRPLEWFCQRSL